MKTLQKWCALAVMSCVASIPTVAFQTDDLDQRLASAYRDKKFSLPKPYCGATLQFDAEGKLVAGGATGAWTLCEEIQVKNIHHTGNVINIAAQRVYLRYDANKRKFRDVGSEVDKHSKTYKDLLDGQQVSIEISMLPTQDAAAVQAAIDNVLTPFDSVLAHPDSELWRDFFPKPQKKPKGDSGIPLKENEVLHVGNGVVAPVPILTPDPEYDAEAKQAKYMGTGIYTVIVDREGNVTSVKVARPLGLGLDEKAAEAVRSWRFNPGLKNGQPVIVELVLEVNFNLY
ncbi:MAG: hypothetical protein DMG65_07470 [Candidatus Angelobacter sp. Gp1-AA117]|nr:MAG: hypothetical protein DMG65_07470 [Candidatus Angelobacter sp. Gp1-AA117]